MKLWINFDIMVVIVVFLCLHVAIYKRSHPPAEQIGTIISDIISETDNVFDFVGDLWPVFRRDGCSTSVLSLFRGENV
jgi:hypothetical protein